VNETIRFSLLWVSQQYFLLNSKVCQNCIRPLTWSRTSVYSCRPVRVAQLYPQVPGSLTATFCRSQSYGGGIITRLRTSLTHGAEPLHTSLTHGAEPFLRSRQLCSHSRTSQDFMEPQGSLPCSQEPFIGPFPEPDQLRCGFFASWVSRSS
jgi:hypothetical protein